MVYPVHVLEGRGAFLSLIAALLLSATEGHSRAVAQRCANLPRICKRLSPANAGPMAGIPTPPLRDRIQGV